VLKHRNKAATFIHSVICLTTGPTYICEFTSIFSNMVLNIFLKCQQESCFQLQGSFYLSLELQKMQVSIPSSFSLQTNSNSVFPSLGNILHVLSVCLVHGIQFLPFPNFCCCRRVNLLQMCHCSNFAIATQFGLESINISLNLCQFQ
jgi:hypothetical protein